MSCYVRPRVSAFSGILRAALGMSHVSFEFKFASQISRPKERHEFRYRSRVMFAGGIKRLEKGRAEGEGWEMGLEW